VPIFESIDGGFLQDVIDDINYYVESPLDLDYAMALVYPQNVTLYQTGDYVEGASFNDFLDALDASYCDGDSDVFDAVYPDPYCDEGDYGCYKGPKTCGGLAAAKVISTSYGYNEADLTPAYEIRQCNEYMKLGLQGTSVLFSSGDSGKPLLPFPFPLPGGLIN
jgi:tripeptidyl-peptidase I